MNVGHSTSGRTVFLTLNKKRLSSMRLTVIAACILLLTLGGASSAWAGAFLTGNGAPIQRTSFSIHIGPGGGVHLGFGRHRHGFRGAYGHSHRHFGHRHYFKPSRPFYRHNYGHRHYWKRHKHGGHFRGKRQYRRHRH